MNDSVRAELGSYPLRIKVYKKMISYWLKVITMHQDRLPYKCYTFLKPLDEVESKANWVTSIKTLLHTFGFGYVWTNQGVANVHNFLNMFEQRCKNVYIQEWRSQTHSINRRFYLAIKSNFTIEDYIKSVTIFKHRRCITLIRTSSHNLNANKVYVNDTDGLCQLCEAHPLEDKFNFCLCALRTTT
jgi:hypothetical protein